MIDVATCLLFLEKFSYVGIFIMLAVFTLFNPIPEEIFLVLVGYIISMGYADFWPGLAVAIFAVIFSDNLIYFVSRNGARFVKRWEEKKLAKNVERMRRNIVENIDIVIFGLRFISLFRSLSPIVAGGLKIPWRKFLLYDTLAVLIYVPTFVYLGFIFHNQISILIEKVHFWMYVVALVLCVIIVALVTIKVRKILAEKLGL